MFVTHAIEKFANFKGTSNILQYMLLLIFASSWCLCTGKGNETINSSFNIISCCATWENNESKWLYSRGCDCERHFEFTILSIIVWFWFMFSGVQTEFFIMNCYDVDNIVIKWLLWMTREKHQEIYLSSYRRVVNSTA